MTKERIEKELSKVRRQIAELQAREQELEEQWQMAEDARAMQIIKKHKISSEKLQLLNKISEDEIRQLLAKKEQEAREHEEQVIG